MVEKAYIVEAYQETRVIFFPLRCQTEVCYLLSVTLCKLADKCLARLSLGNAGGFKSSELTLRRSEAKCHHRHISSQYHLRFSLFSLYIFCVYSGGDSDVVIMVKSKQWQI